MDVSHFFVGWQIPCNSLLGPKNSLLGVQKFPAPMRGEFRCKWLNLCALLAQKSA